MKGLQGFKFLFLLALSIFISVGCSSGGGGDDGIDGTGLKGTAAKGAPISNAPVIIKDGNGKKVSLTTDEHGRFGIEAKDIGDLSPPFIIKVEVDTN